MTDFNHTVGTRPLSKEFWKYFSNSNDTDLCFNILFGILFHPTDLFPFSLFKTFINSSQVNGLYNGSFGISWSK